MTDESVLLRNRGDIVGFAKYVLDSGTLREEIHGHSLAQFAKRGERLVAVHSVQIFEEFEAQQYPYAYRGFEDPPVLLGDLNKIEKAFKHVIAWDNHKVVRNPRPSIAILHASPRTVSANLINPIRATLTLSPKKVRFARTVNHSLGSSIEQRNRNIAKPADTRYRSFLQQLKGSEHHSDGFDDLADPVERFEESVDQFADELDAEGGAFSSGRPEQNGGDAGNVFQQQMPNDCGLKTFTERFEESVDQFADELDAEEARLSGGPEQTRRDGAGVFQHPKDHHMTEEVREKDVLQTTERSGGEASDEIQPNVRQNERMDEHDSPSPTRYLSPAERIHKKLREKKATSRSKKAKPGGRHRKVCRQRDSHNASSSGNGLMGRVNQPHSVDATIPQLGTSENEVDDTIQSSEGHETPVLELGRTTQDYTSTLLANEADPIRRGVERSPESFHTDVQSCPLPLSFDQLAMSSVKSRSYRHKTRRKAAAKKNSDLQKKRIKLWKKTFKENPFNIPRGCCNAGCFFLVNPEYAVVQYRKFLLMTRPDRKRALKSMYIRGAMAFWFDGAYVCSRFLVKGLTFSNQLQSAVKGTPKARASASIIACPRESNKETKKNQIIVYLSDLAKRIGDSLPTKPHENLPLMNKKQVMERFRKYNRDMGMREDPSMGYFYSVWKKFCANIKTHRHHGFTVCDTCERIRVAFQMSDNERVEAILRKELEAHHEFVERERRDYERRRDLAKRSPEKYLSMIVDGADQKSYGLPHFVFQTKADKGEKLKMKIVGVLEHGSEKQLSLFTLTEEFESGANHIIEAIHRVLNRTKAKHRKLPPVLFLQADNCTRENKNRFLLSYLDLLVKKGVFQEVQLCFLPIGHTHADIDQAFSSVATRFKLERAITDQDMLNLLRHCYTPRAFAEAMNEVANFSALCQSSGCVRNVEGFSQYRFFRFTRKAPPEIGNHGEDDFFPTTCDVKFQATEEWTPLDNSANREGFLKFVPNLQDTPTTDTTPPDNVLEVNKHLRSCEHRMQTVQNLRVLEALRDRVYTRRSQPFHWDLENSFEECGDYRGSMTDESDEIEAAIHHAVEGEDLGYIEKLSYSLNCFLAVKTTHGCRDPFWIARTLRIAEVDQEGDVMKLKVRWYQAKDAADAFASAYVMSTYVKDGERALFDDTVDVRSILCEFESLTRNGGLHVRTQKAIRQTLNLH